MEIDTAIRIFSEFLNKAYLTVQPLLLDRAYTSDESSIDDWLQMNWEILIERKVLPLGEYLEVYGNGADFYGSTSRITDIEALPTYSVNVLITKSAFDVLNNKTVSVERYQLERLVGFVNGYYIDEPPFDFVLVNDDSKQVERVFKLKEVEFGLNKLS